LSRRSTILSPAGHDGTSQRGRHLPALDPKSVAIDERGHVELLEFVQAFADRLRFFDVDDSGDAIRDAGSWSAFARRDDVSSADIVAYMADPQRFDGDRARWLGRPHFALLLTFLELLGHARDQLNGLTGRHLDHYYREVLRMVPAPAVADRAAVVFRLAAGVAQVRLPAGTALQAGRDSTGVPRIYRTELEVYVSRARVASLRAIHVHRRITGISDIRRDRGLSAREAFERTLAIALGDPRPGDPVPPWAGTPVNLEFVHSLRPLLEFSNKNLFLEHHELRKLMQLVRRRDAADREWAEINRLLGVANPAKPRDFAQNLAQVVGPLDFKADELPDVDDIDELFERRTDPDVRKYIDKKLVAIGFDKFVALMVIKRRIDAEWAEINRVLERIGRGRRHLLAWDLDPADPTAFAANLANALIDPPPWPWGTKSIDEYEATVRKLEAHLSMTAERLARLAAFAEQAEPDEAAWSDLDRILADAHREKTYAARRRKLAAIRGVHDDIAGFDATVAFALGRQQEPPGWTDARGLLLQYVDRGQVDLLDHFRRQLVEPATAWLFGWVDVDRVLELAQRWVEGLPEPVARRIEWRNLHAYDDATAVHDDPTSPRWRTFGRNPPVTDEAHPPIATIGWALRSPVLALSQGKRTLALTFGFLGDGFDLASFVRGLGLTPGAFDEAGLRAALAGALQIEASCAAGWVPLALTGAQVVAGGPGKDYWSLRGVLRALDEDRPALRLVLQADATVPPLAPLAKSGEPWPALRLTLRQRWDQAAHEWITSYTPFAALRIAAVHLRVDVEGLVDLQLQHDDRALDPRKPFEPFGSRPAVGSRLYLGHPELVRGRLDLLRFDIEWMGLPARLKAHYLNYPGVTGGGSFIVRMTLVDRNLDVRLADAPLFEDNAQNATKPACSLLIPDVPAALAATSPGYAYERRLEVGQVPAADLRTASRHLRWELTPNDFGHAIHPSLAATKARALAVKIATNTLGNEDPENYRVDAPYTPKIQRLSVAYGTSIEIDPRATGGDDRVLHVHPFGVCPIDGADARFFPDYAQAGELYIGLHALAPPQRLALLFQLAEGTSNPDLERAPVVWSYLDGDRWVDLGDGGMLGDSTRGLSNSGIVEVVLPVVAPGTRLPAGLFWLRATIPRDPDSVCDTVAILAQATTARFDDHGNAPDHHEQPLPVGSIDRLAVPNPRIASVEQPYTSFGGMPAERAEQFHTRVSERLRHKQRALSPWDYERLVLQRFGQIYRAKCLSAGAARRRYAEPGDVDLIVIPDVRQQRPSDVFAPKAPADLLVDIEAYMRDRSPAAAAVRVRNAQYVAVMVRLGVKFTPGADEGFAKKQLNDDLVRFLSPWAFDEGAELVIGGRIYASSILDFVDRRDYVDYIAELKLFRSVDGEQFDMVPPEVVDYHVGADRPDQVLVAARQHHIDIISELGYQQASFTGINYMKVELDFIVG